jgi:YbbR domain-containing protein
MKDLLLHNWHLKLVSLALATVLWAQVARTPTSEIGLLVLPQIQNIPEQAEAYGDTTDRVEVRLRGPSSVMRTLSLQDVSLSIDVTGMSIGQEKIIPLTPEMVDKPFGVEVVRVIPARVRLTVEPTVTRRVRLVPAVTDDPAPGFEVNKALLTPDTVEIEGPESHVVRVETIPATVSVRGRRETFKEAVDPDISDPLIRIPKPDGITAEVRIRPQSK